LLGFALFWLAISALPGEHSQMAPPMVLWITALPLLDSVCVMLRRITKGRSPFQPDREHLHHIFHVAGFSINVTLAILVFVSLSLAMIGITVNHYFSDPDPILFGLFMLLFVGHFWMISKAWTMMKITRYVLATRTTERRIQHIDVASDRRSGADRRFIPSGQELENFRKYRNGRVFRLRRFSAVFKHKFTI
jgi:UDP-GlcNAc:undecaprenyl-phosphate GlcNAc-1-phosphate transferase